MPPPADPLPQLSAREIVAAGPSALERLKEKEAWKFGELWSFSPEENERLKALADRIENYLGFADHKRPLCIAVFGPPGSGKSFGVEQIFKELNEKFSSAKSTTSLGWAVLNVTQFASPQKLAREVVDQATKIRCDGAVPFIFFDEFDASLNGAPLGWLSWFLAPMQDGTFVAGGKSFELKKAVYVFAGGTAAKMEEFGASDKQAFSLAKGPDFVSRLQSHIDVRGPNDPEARELRRGMALSLALKQTRKRTGRKNVQLEDALIDRLVLAGRYRHGQRSVEAVITMMAERIAPTATTIGLNALPPSFLLDMQVDRGPLDPETIGGLIGLSGGGFPTAEQAAALSEMWMELAATCWRLGATVAYGGNWDKNGLTQVLLNLPLPTRLRESVPEPRLEIHAREKPSTSDSRATVVKVLAPLGPPGDVQSAAHLFRMRWQSGARCRARVLLSGKVSGKSANKFSGRMPGIIEEAMVSIALGQPIYVLGGFGGAAAVLGELLGLASWKKSAELLEPVDIPALDTAAHLFRPAGFTDLPLTMEEALSYIAGHAIGGPGWEDNGLTAEENRKLFELDVDLDVNSRKEAIRLIERGLLRVFDK